MRRAEAARAFFLECSARRRALPRAPAHVCYGARVLLVSCICCGSSSSSNCCWCAVSRGAPGSLVVAKDLTCSGGELDLMQCAWAEPTADCQQHGMDSVVYCGDAGAGVQEGSVRMLTSEGAPSIDGLGRLEMFWKGAWGPVCKDNFAGGGVACKQMGFTGFLDAFGCAAVNGENYCAPVAPRISEMSCRGTEVDVAACAFEAGDDVFCAPSEGVALKCAGDGVTQGRLRAPPAPEVQLAAPP